MVIIQVFNGKDRIQYKFIICLLLKKPMLLTTRTSYTTSGKFKTFQTELALGFVINSQMLRCLMYGMSKDFLKFTRFRAESLANKILVNTKFGYVQISTL